MAFLQRLGVVLRQNAARSSIQGSTSQVLPALFTVQRGMAGSKIFVGGLPWEVSEDTLKEAFGQFGEIEEAKIIFDRATGQSRGFGFISFLEEESAKTALEEMDGRDFAGRTIRVDYATQRAPGEGGDRSGFGGRGGYGGRGGGGRGYGGGGGGRGGYSRGGYGGDREDYD